jgi:hypothetical protein
VTERLPVSVTISLGGAAVLAALAIARLPSPAAFLHPPSTPFDRSVVPNVRASFLLIQKAADVVPRGASVVVLSEPASPAADTDLFREGVALLPGRRVLPAAVWGVPTPDLGAAADFVIVRGPLPAIAPGTLLLSIPEGTVWRRAP